MVRLLPNHFLAIRQNSFRIHSGCEATFVTAMLTFATTVDSDSAITDGLAFESGTPSVLK
jgi:hypothetical protein